jgi:hypothetical protein
VSQPTTLAKLADMSRGYTKFSTTCRKRHRDDTAHEISTRRGLSDCRPSAVCPAVDRKPLWAVVGTPDAALQRGCAARHFVTVTFSAWLGGTVASSRRDRSGVSRSVPVCRRIDWQAAASCAPVCGPKRSHNRRRRVSPRWIVAHYTLSNWPFRRRRVPSLWPVIAHRNSQLAFGT